MTNKEDKEGGHEASGAVEMIFGYLAFCLSWRLRFSRWD
jgi:hypothetical protein